MKPTPAQRRVLTLLTSGKVRLMGSILFIPGANPAIEVMNLHTFHALKNRGWIECTKPPLFYITDAGRRALEE